MSNLVEASESESVAPSMIQNVAGIQPKDGKGALCRMCLLKTNRFDNMFATPGYKIRPNGKRLMTRMDRFQRKVLQTEFERSPNWAQEKVEALASRLNITKAKVYKWNWDQRNKQRDALFAQRSVGDTSHTPLVVPDGIAPIVP